MIFLVCIYPPLHCSGLNSDIVIDYSVLPSSSVSEKFVNKH